jgi:hypothetical protein
MNEIFPLVYFTHAELKEKENLKVNLEEIVGSSGNDLKKFKLNNSSSLLHNGRNNKRLKLTIQDENMSYEALEEEEQPFLVGVLNKSDGQLSVCNTSYFLMKPECYLNNNGDNNEENLTIDQEKTSYSDKLNSLTAAFGSSKKRKAMQTKLKNKLDTQTLDTAISIAVEETKNSLMKLAAIERKNDENGTADLTNLEQFSIMPVANKEAKEPNEVYNLNEVLEITQNEFDRFTLELSKKFAISTNESVSKWKEMNIYPDYVCEHLSQLINSKSNQQYKMLKCKQLAYMSYLIQLYRLNSAQLKAKSPLATYQISDSTVNKLFSIYTVVSVDNSQAKKIRSMPRRLKDKLTCHILVLALFIDDYLTTLDGLQKDLKLSIQKLVDFYQALGCFIKSSVVTVDKKRIISKKANLTLPLNEVSKGEKKKRERKL